MGRGNSREGGGQGVICIARGRPGRSTRSTAECSRRGWPRRCSPARWGSPRAPRASPRRSQGCRRPRNSRTKSFVPRPSARSRPGGTWRWPRQAAPPPVAAATFVESRQPPCLALPCGSPARPLAVSPAGRLAPEVSGAVGSPGGGGRSPRQLVLRPKSSAPWWRRAAARAGQRGQRGPTARRGTACCSARGAPASPRGAMRLPSPPSVSETRVLGSRDAVGRGAERGGVRVTRALGGQACAFRGGPGRGVCRGVRRVRSNFTEQRRICSAARARRGRAGSAGRDGAPRRAHEREPRELQRRLRVLLRGARRAAGLCAPRARLGTHRPASGPCPLRSVRSA